MDKSGAILSIILPNFCLFLCVCVCVVANGDSEKDKYA